MFYNSANKFIAYNQNKYKVHGVKEDVFFNHDEEEGDDFFDSNSKKKKNKRYYKLIASIEQSFKFDTHTMFSFQDLTKKTKKDILKSKIIINEIRKRMRSIKRAMISIKKQDFFKAYGIKSFAFSDHIHRKSLEEIYNKTQKLKKTLEKLELSVDYLIDPKIFKVLVFKASRDDEYHLNTFLVGIKDFQVAFSRDKLHLFKEMNRIERFYKRALSSVNIQQLFDETEGLINSIGQDLYEDDNFYLLVKLKKQIEYLEKTSNCEQKVVQKINSIKQHFNKLRDKNLKKLS